MLVTGNGVVLEITDEDFLFDALFGPLFDTADSLDDDAAEHALDTICFLQDDDPNTPMDASVGFPYAMTTTDFDLSD